MTFLKDCPNCGMTVAAHCECPICKADITDISYSERRWEKYKLNKFFWPYAVRKCWFFLLCFVIVICKLAFFGITVRLDATVTGVYVLSTFLWLALSFAGSLFLNWIKSIGEWKYNDSYLDMTSGRYVKYLSGVMALLFSIIW